MAHMFCTLKQAADRLGTSEAQIKTMLDNGTLREFRDGSRRLLKVADLADVEIVSRPASLGGAGATTPHKAKSSPDKGTRPTSASRGSGKVCPSTASQASASPGSGIKLPPTATATAVPSRPRMQPPAQLSRPARPAADKPAHPAGASAAALAPAAMERSVSADVDRQLSTEDSAYTIDRQDPVCRPELSVSVGPCSGPQSKPATVPRRPAAVRPASLPSRPRPQTREMSLRHWIWMGLLDDQPIAILLLFAIVGLGVGAVTGAIYFLTQAF
jgi:excisionase family DNA binding protein